MATPTYIPLATITLGSTTSSVTLSDIPAIYRDLVIVIQATINSGAAGIEVFLNEDTTATNYYSVVMLGNGSSTSSYSQNNNAIPSFTTSQGQAIIQLFDYSQTDKQKTILTRNDVPSDYTLAIASRWSSTAAINTIRMQDTSSGRTFNAGSTFSLYGVN